VVSGYFRHGRRIPLWYLNKRCKSQQKVACRQEKIYRLFRLVALKLYINKRITTD